MVTSDGADCTPCHCFLTSPDTSHDFVWPTRRLDSSAEERTLLAARGRELALQEPVAAPQIDDGTVEAPKTDVRCSRVRQ